MKGISLARGLGVAVPGGAVAPASPAPPSPQSISKSRRHVGDSMGFELWRIYRNGTGTKGRECNGIRNGISYPLVHP